MLVKLVPYSKYECQSFSKRVFSSKIPGQSFLFYTVVKLTSKYDDGGGRKNSPLDGASALCQGILLQPGK